MSRDADACAKCSIAPFANTAQAASPDPSVQPAVAPTTSFSLEQLKEASKLLIEKVDLSTTSIKIFRGRVAEHLGLGALGLESKQDDLRAIFEDVVREEALTKKASHAHDDEIELGEEKSDASKQAYVVTASHTITEFNISGTKLVTPSSYSREQVRDLMLQALEATQAAKLIPLTILLMAIFQERHVSGQIHYHIALIADRCFRFNPLKKELLRLGGLATHWSCTHDGYASCVAYGYLPSLTKRPEHLDPTPLTWAPEGKVHPPLKEASRAPVTAKASAKRREKERLGKAAEGKSEPRFRDVDLWPIVIQENIPVDELSAERVMLYAKRCGGYAMVDFCFHNWDRLPALVARSWKVERVENYIEQHSKSRIDILHEAASGTCACGGEWLAMALKILKQNNINPCDWTDAVWQAFVEGRAKGNLVCHAGLVGNEGKRWFWRPLNMIFEGEGVFVAPPKGGFPFMGLERARLTWLDDWRFNEDIISYALQLLWFEGAPFVIARPQNTFTGHLRYARDDPVFITTLEEDITALKGKRFLKQGDIDMMLKRLRIFRFFRQVSIPKKLIKGCPRCFARLVLGMYQQYDKNQVHANSSSSDTTHDNTDRKKRKSGPSVCLPVAVKKASVPGAEGGNVLVGMPQLVAAAKVPAAKAAAMQAELVALGAVHVQELAAEDWQNLTAWAELAPFEQRRLIAHFT